VNNNVDVMREAAMLRYVAFYCQEIALMGLSSVQGMSDG
jgi:hypothetical protein